MNHFFKANLRQIQCYSELKEKENTRLFWCRDMRCLSPVNHPPYVILSGFTNGNWTLKGVEIATSNLERREKFVHPVLCYAQEPQFYRESWYWNIHHEFSRQAFDIIWNLCGMIYALFWYAFQTILGMMLLFHDHVSLVSQYPSAKAFWIAISVREKRPTPSIFFVGF